MKKMTKFAAILVAGLLAQSAQAQQIITAINTDDDAADVHTDIVSTTSGALVGNAYLGNDVHALTGLGVNKAYASASNGIEQSATSAWLDSYTATAGTGMIHLSFGFTIDGSANMTYDYDTATPYYSFKVFALRGDGWSLNGMGGAATGQWYAPAYAGDDYDDLYLERNIAGAPISQLSVKYDYDGFYNYTNNAGQPGAFLGKISKIDSSDAFLRVTDSGGVRVYEYFYADRVRRRVGPSPNPYTTTYYNDGTSAGAQARAVRNNLDANYSMLDSTALCDITTAEGDDYLCEARTYEPTMLTLEFDIASGSKFTLAAALVIDQLTDGTIDFFNTAKLTSISATSQSGGPVTLTSQSGALISNGDGTFGYPALSTAVPEPASWALMIGGFGLAGGALRRRAARPRPAAFA